MSTHMRAILDPDVPVCRGEMADGDLLGRDREADCDECFAVRGGKWIHSIKRTAR